MSNIETESLSGVLDVPAGAVIWRGTDREVRETLVHFETYIASQSRNLQVRARF